MSVVAFLSKPDSALFVGIIAGMQIGAVIVWVTMYLTQRAMANALREVYADTDKEDEAA